MCTEGLAQYWCAVRARGFSVLYIGLWGKISLGKKKKAWSREYLETTDPKPTQFMKLTYKAPVHIL